MENNFDSQTYLRGQVTCFQILFHGPIWWRWFFTQHLSTTVCIGTVELSNLYVVQHGLWPAAIVLLMMVLWRCNYTASWPWPRSFMWAWHGGCDCWLQSCLVSFPWSQRPGTGSILCLPCSVGINDFSSDVHMSLWLGIPVQWGM